MMPQILALVLLAQPAAQGADIGSGLQVRPLRDPLVVEVLASAELQDLNHRLPRSGLPFVVRLFAVGRTGTCVEGTEAVCSHRYVLAVSEYGEAPAQAAYDLGEVGQLVPLRWLAAGPGDRAALEVEARRYPESATKANPKLQIRTRQYRLDVALEPGAPEPRFVVSFAPLK